jgi:hypothetical protein
MASLKWASIGKWSNGLFADWRSAPRFFTDFGPGLGAASRCLVAQTHDGQSTDPMPLRMANIAA